MRSLLTILLVIAAVTLAAYFALVALRFDPSKRDMLVAAVACAASAQVALLPAVRKRGQGIMPLFQAGLIGTVLHLFLTVAIGAVVILGGLTVEKKTFLYTILILYWASLAAMVSGLVRFLRDETARLQATAAKAG